MRKLALEYETRLGFSAPVRDHRFQLRCIPPDLPQQRICDLAFDMDPACPTFEEVDSFHNHVMVGHIPEAHASFSYHMSAIAFVDQSLARPSPYKPLYRYQSALTRQGPVLEALSGEVRAAIGASRRVDSPLEQARYACSVVHERIAYVPGATTVRTSAEEALAGGRGVCQDYAQVAVSVCRALGLLSKYVAGVYAAEGATHAWMEVYQAGRWHGLDPTNDCAVDDSYVKIANGRDYGDCVLEIGVFSGEVDQTQSVHARVSELAADEQ